MKFWIYEKAAKAYCFFDRFAASGEDGQPLTIRELRWLRGSDFSGIFHPSAHPPAMKLTRMA
jgi:hypothetical protein